MPKLNTKTTNTSTDSNTSTSETQTEYLDSHLQHDTKFVLHFQDFDEDGTKDLALFVLYNDSVWNEDDETDNGYFYIVGKRPDSKKRQYAPFSFRCEKRDVNHFIACLIGSNKFAMTFYNYNNFISDNLDYEMPFEHFESLQSRSYEITGFDNMLFTNAVDEKTVKEYLRLIQYAF